MKTDECGATHLVDGAAVPCVLGRSHATHCDERGREWNGCGCGELRSRVAELERREDSALCMLRDMTDPNDTRDMLDLIMYQSFGLDKARADLATAKRLLWDVLERGGADDHALAYLFLRKNLAPPTPEPDHDDD